MFLKEVLGLNSYARIDIQQRWNGLVFWEHFSASALTRGSMNSKVRDTEQRGFEDAKEQQKEKKKSSKQTLSLFFK